MSTETSLENLIDFFEEGDSKIGKNRDSFYLAMISAFQVSDATNKTREIFTEYPSTNRKSQWKDGVNKSHECIGNMKFIIENNQN